MKTSIQIEDSADGTLSRLFCDSPEWIYERRTGFAHSSFELARVITALRAAIEETQRPWQGARGVPRYRARPPAARARGHAGASTDRAAMVSIRAARCACDTDLAPVPRVHVGGSSLSRGTEMPRRGAWGGPALPRTTTDLCPHGATPRIHCPNAALICSCVSAAAAAAAA